MPESPRLAPNPIREILSLPIKLRLTHFTVLKMHPHFLITYGYQTSEASETDHTTHPFYS